MLGLLLDFKWQSEMVQLIDDFKSSYNFDCWGTIPPFLFATHGGIYPISFLIFEIFIFQPLTLKMKNFGPL